MGMRKTIMFAAAAALMAMVSCSREELFESAGEGTQETEGAEAPVFTASIAGTTKTAIDMADGKVAWEPDDEITVWDKTGCYEIYSIQSISSTGHATFVKKGGGKSYLQPGPYRATYGTEPKAIQSYGATVNDLYMTAPATSTGSFVFTVQCGMMKIGLTKAGREISMIEVTGTPTDGAETTFILNCKPGRNIAKARDFFISLPAGKYTRVEISDVSGAVCTLKSEAGVEVAANHIRPLTFGEDRLDFKDVLVDLGVSVKWAACNLGAANPEQYGKYYQWGGTADVNDRNNPYSLDYAHCPSHVETHSEGDKGWLKYIPSDKSSYWSGAGAPDNRTVLGLEDDAARVKLGGDWRMPTDAEWDELKKNCRWEWATVNGVNGYKVYCTDQGRTDVCIFLPAAGYRFENGFAAFGEIGSYWFSSLNADQPNTAHYLRFTQGNKFEMGSQPRYMGFSIRPVHPRHQHHLERIPTSLASAGVAGCKEAYHCTDPLCSLYFEDAEGTVLIGGESEYKAWKSLGGRGYLVPVPAVVDLGLSVKWASLNLGASKPEEYGGLYQWAGTEDVCTSTLNLFDLHNAPYFGTEYEDGWRKYYVPDGTGSKWIGPNKPDNKTVLDLMDDAAHATLSGNWRMPTNEEWIELYDNCTWTWTSLNGVNGYRVQSRKSGYTDKWIFLPAAGFRAARMDNVGSRGYYWSSSLMEGIPDNGLYLSFSQQSIYSTDGHLRSVGISVRPVYSEKGRTPGDVLEGEFSVSDSKKVRFTKGNLWADASNTLHFESRQNGFNEDYQTSHVSHFTWASSVSDAVDINTGSYLFCDESHKQSVNGSEAVYYALSSAEWQYLFGHHSYRWVTAGGVNGYAIAPDDFRGTIADKYTDDIALSEAGLLFLPAAGYRELDETEGCRQVGNYWSSVPSGSDEAHDVVFDNENVMYLSGTRSTGQCIRLVKNADIH